MSAWRLDHLDAYDAALPWLSDADVVDTTNRTPEQVARHIATIAGERT